MARRRRQKSDHAARLVTAAVLVLLYWLWRSPDTLLPFLAVAVIITMFVVGLLTFRHPTKGTIDPGFTVNVTRPASSTPRWSLELIRSLEWKRFEDLCGLYFEAMGYVVRNTGLGADGGADFLLYIAGRESTKPFGIIQCKAWNRWKVGVRPIRELFGVMTDAGAEIGVFATSSGYTKEAERFASNKHIQLLNGERLLALITTKLDATQQVELLRRITTGDYTTPSCPNCGTKLVLRETARPFWGCRNFPRCRYTLNLRRESA